MDTLSALTESDFKGRENHITAQNVASGVTCEEADLSGKTSARCSQLNLQIEEIKVPRACKRVYPYPVSVGDIPDSKQRVFGTEYSKERTRVEDRNGVTGPFAVKQSDLSGGLDSLHIGHGPICDGDGIVDYGHAK